MRNILWDCFIVNKDHNLAFNWYMKAANANHIDALCAVGDCYFSGYGVLQSYVQAFIFWQKSAKLGNPDAMFRVGDCYHFGWGVTEDISYAIELYTMAAENGCKDAQEALDEL